DSWLVSGKGDSPAGAELPPEPRKKAQAEPTFIEVIPPRPSQFRPFILGLLVGIALAGITSAAVLGLGRSDHEKDPQTEKDKTSHKDKPIDPPESKEKKELAEAKKELETLKNQIEATRTAHEKALADARTTAEQKGRKDALE